MNLLEKITHKLIFSDDPVESGSSRVPSRYKRMWRKTVIVVSLTSVVPLIVMTLVNYYTFQRTFQEEISHPVQRITSITKRSLESFLEERIAAAKYIVSRESFDDLYDQHMMSLILKRMKNSFGGIVDIGVIDSNGVLRSYAGPYNLLGKNYKDQDWFNKVYLRDIYVSDVFLGHRKLPHFIIAVKHEDDKGRVYIFRATIDTDVLDKQILGEGLKQNSDAFIISKSGVLQTPSHYFGSTLSDFPGPAPVFASGAEIVENHIVHKTSYLMGFAYIKDSPFIFIILTRTKDLMKGWLSFRTEILGFMGFSIVAILIIIMGITSNWVTRIKASDIKREANLHNIEHTNKMASIGRLAAGVAHEINNPLAIINEKAGLIKDIMGQVEEMPHQEKMLQQVDSVLRSVKRCSDITHRLLGFARHMDVEHEPLTLDALIRDVLLFLEREASYRDIHINMEVADTLPVIVSDKSQLQQLFLNVINNAFDAMGKGGHLDIKIEEHPPDSVAITITDDGHGIPKKDLDRIFDPFFTTKESEGVGLGLSICYGIVQKLKGRMTVESEVGKGTSFTIILPTNQEE